MELAEVVRLADRIIKHPLFTVQGQALTLIDVATFVAILSMTVLSARFLSRAARRALQARGVEDPGTHAIARRLIRFSVLAVGIGTAITNLGFDLSAVFAAAAVLGVGIGFAFQGVAQNFISGLLLLFERSIKPGDILEVDGRVVRVEDLRIRATVARTRNDDQVIIPNSALAQGTVTNFTMSDTSYRIQLTVGVAYASDMARVRACLERAALGLDGRLASREPVVLMKAFAASAVNFEVSVWIDDPWRARRALSDLHEAVWWSLKEEEITIAFPQVDVHLDPDLYRHLDRLPRAG